jgi:DivIVA domain-containing protein
MDDDDPEKRISELERQLAEPRVAGPAGAPATAGLTPELVHNVAFAKPPIGKRGYNEDQVDAFLDLIEAALRDPSGVSLSPEQVRNVAFAKPPIGQRGYNEDQVDAFLDLIEAALRDPSGVSLSPEQVRNVAFAKPPIGQRGYNEDQVDAFLDFVAQQLQPQHVQQGAHGPPPTGRLSARHGTEKHAGEETWFRRVVNVAIRFFASILEN